MFLSLKRGRQATNSEDGPPNQDRAADREQTGWLSRARIRPWSTALEFLQADELLGGEQAFRLLEEGRHGRGGEIKLGVFHAFAGRQRIRKFAQRTRRTLDQEDLEIVVIFQMYVHRGNDHQEILVLNVGQL